MAFGVLSLLWLVPWAFVRLPKLASARERCRDADVGMVLRQKSLWGTSLGLFSSNYTWYFMLGWLPGYLVKERGFSMHEMEHVGTLGYSSMASARLRPAGPWTATSAVGGSANFAYKFIMVVAHAGAVPCMLGMAFGSRTSRSPPCSSSRC